VNVRWTAEQVAAITSPRDVLLEASAGTGKTTTIVGRILWSLGLDVGLGREGSTPLPPCPDPCRLDEIAAITFTEKAAHDLRDKLRSALESTPGGEALRWELERATVGTIHGFAAELLREHALRLDIDPTFRILDEREADIQQAGIVRGVVADALRERDPGAVELTKRHGLTGWKMAPGAVDRVRAVMRDLRWRAREYENWSLPTGDERYTRVLDLDGLRERARFAGAWGEDLEAIEKDETSLMLSDALYRLGRASVHAWLSWLERENARDFDSLILDARRLLTRPGTRSALDAIRRRFRLLVIDEFQDTDRAQWDIATAIMGPDEADRTGPRVVVVGDPKQSIYRFRGADIDVWNAARETFARIGEVLELSWNFRCEPRLVEFVNRVGEGALGETAAALEASSPDSVIGYHPLRGARPASPAAGLEWIAVDEPKAPEQREEEARRVAGRLSELIGEAVVVDPDSGSLRPCRAADVAILSRRNDDLTALETALRAYGIPFYNSATSGLADQQEVHDLVSALRVIENPYDDLAAFAFLRSPFVGLRDEVLAAIALAERTGGGPDGDTSGSLLQRAARYLDAGAWFEAPEGEEIARIERAALAAGLEGLAGAQALANRADHAEVLDTLLERTGYRLHLLLRDGASETLANVERLLALLEENRHLGLRSVLALWDRWGEEDLGVPRARLYSSGDDVVTLSTVHAAKGLEWPVVVLLATGAPLPDRRRYTGEHWGDPALGPVLLARQDQRGPRGEAALERRLRQEEAEEARLLYVAATRARDRLLVVGPTEPARRSLATWLAAELPDAVEAHQASEAEPEGVNGRRAPRAAVSDDLATGTGRQIDAFGFDERPQLDLFAGGAPREWPRAADDVRMVIRRHGASIQTSMREPPVSLRWLADIEPSPWPPSVAPIESPANRIIGSATERMMRLRDAGGWSLRYEHGVLPGDEFLPSWDEGEALPARTRGTVIHGVLERIREEEELARVLDETISSLDLGDLELALASGSRYRAALEAEIARVVRSPEWEWYVQGVHYTELRFLHRSEGGWIQGAFDLWRPGEQATAPQGSLFDGGGAGDDAHLDGWVVDFKTHRIEADRVPEVAETYRGQVEVYRGAAEALAGGRARDGEARPIRVGLHFTHPNVVVEVRPELSSA